MAQKVSRWVKLKKFLKRNMTPTWAKHFAYQVCSLIISIIMVIGVASYAITKSYDERKLSFVDGFTITAHAGSFDTEDNSVESIKAAINNNVAVCELDVRQRPDGTLVMAHDIVVTNRDGTELTEVFELLSKTDITINLDIKETGVLNSLHDMLVEYSMYDRAILTGIEPTDADAVKQSNCADMVYYLNYVPSRTKIFSDEYQQKLLKLVAESGAVGINCNYSFAGAQLSHLMHDNGYKLSVWTVDKVRDMKRMLVIKPDNITTREYDTLLSVIDDWGK